MICYNIPVSIGGGSHRPLTSALGLLELFYEKFGMFSAYLCGLSGFFLHLTHLHVVDPKLPVNVSIKGRLSTSTLKTLAPGAGCTPRLSL